MIEDAYASSHFLVDRTQYGDRRRTAGGSSSRLLYSTTNIQRPDFALVFFCPHETPTLAGLADFVRMSVVA